MIFVTGGTGMLGAHLMLRLIKQGKQVRALKRKGSNLEQARKIFSWNEQDGEELFSRIEWVDGDILDSESIAPHLQSVNTIFHCAAIVSFDTRQRNRMIHNNEAGTSNLVNLALDFQIEKFCHVSSIAALGNPPEGIAASEKHIWNGGKERSAYSVSKFLSEMQVWRGIAHGLDAVIVNPSVIIGPGDWNSGSPRLFKTVWNGMKFYTQGGTGFVCVDDVVRAMTQLMQPACWKEVCNQRYVLNASNETYQDVFNRIADVLKRNRPAILASDILLGLGWRLSSFLSILTSKPPVISRDSVRSAKEISTYDGSKICKTIDFRYTSVLSAIDRAGKVFLKEHQR